MLRTHPAPPPWSSRWTCRGYGRGMKGDGYVVTDLELRPDAGKGALKDARVPIGRTSLRLRASARNLRAARQAGSDMRGIGPFIPHRKRADSDTIGTYNVKASSTTASEPSATGLVRTSARALPCPRAGGRAFVHCHWALGSALGSLPRHARSRTTSHRPPTLACFHACAYMWPAILAGMRTRKTHRSSDVIPPPHTVVRIICCGSVPIL